MLCFIIQGRNKYYHKNGIKRQRAQWARASTSKWRLVKRGTIPWCTIDIIENAHSFSTWTLHTDPTIQWPNQPQSIKNAPPYLFGVLFGVSIFFWCWAWYNTICRWGFDLGIVSFFGAAVSSAWLLYSTLRGGKICNFVKKTAKDETGDNHARVGRENGNGDKDGNEEGVDMPLGHSPPGACLRSFTLVAHLFVAVNYLLGFVIALTSASGIRVSFAIYCFIFTILWSISAYAFWVLIGAYRSAVIPS